MFKSIRSRLTISYLLVVLLAMTIAAGLAWNALDRAFLEVLRQNLLAQARRVAQTVEAGGAGGLAAPGTDTSGPYSQASNVMPGYHTRVVDDEGVVVLDLAAADGAISGDTLSPAGDGGLAANLGLTPPDGGSPAVPADLFAREEIQRALEGEPATALRSYDWAPERRVLYAAYPVRSPQGEVTRVAYVASPIPRLALSLLPATLGWQMLGGAGAAVALAGLAGWLLARGLTRPLRRLTGAASGLARGEPVPPIPPASTAELDLLRTAFNTMNANLTAAHGALAAQARQREAILDSLADAVLAADAVGEITLANPTGSALLEFAAQPLHEAIRHTLITGEPYATEITARGQVVQLLITPLRDEDGRVSGAVAVGHDVTSYRQLDRLRTNFVSDVSHELRTPLTAIKGFVETLQDGAADDPAARDQFLRTVAAETERLICLTNDLLLLARADAGRLDLRLAPADLVACARRAVVYLEGRAREGRVAVTVEPPPCVARALADADRIHQVLVNLLDNALKFTPAGGRVSITFDRTGEQVSCTVTDTGPGIPADEMPHLFERFYRGDRSRSRSAGESGAGLGLAIARTIVEAHGGHLWAESGSGCGASFTFTLPSAA